MDAQGCGVDYIGVIKPILSKVIPSAAFLPVIFMRFPSTCDKRIGNLTKRCIYLWAVTVHIKEKFPHVGKNTHHLITKANRSQQGSRQPY